MKMTDRKKLHKVQGIVIFSLALLILAYNLFHVQNKPAILLFMSFGMMVMLLPNLKKSIRYITVGMLITGHALFFIYSLNFSVWKEAMSLNLGLISLFAFVPMFMLPITYGGYLASVENELKAMQGQKTKLQFLLSFLTFALGAVLNLAIMRILFPIFKQTELDNRQLARAMLIGFTSTNIWSPYFASVAIITQILNLPYARLGPLIFTLALLHFMIGNIILFLLSKKAGKKETPYGPSKDVPLQDRSERKKIRSLTITMFSIFIILFFMERFTEYSMAVLVSLMGLAGTIVWLILLKGVSRVLAYIRSYIFDSLPAVGNEISLFIGAGFFGMIVMNTPLSEGLNMLLGFLAGNMPIFLLIACLVALPMVLSIFGIHQIITITLLATAISPEAIHLTPLAYGVMLAAAWCHASAISPFSPVNITISILLNQKSLRAGIQNNYQFIMLTFAATVLFVYLLNLG